MHPGRLAPFLLVFALALGCQQQDEIVKYTARKDAAPPAVAAGKVRLLAAIYPHGDQTWFFKMTGPEDAVAKREAEFDKFLETVKFTGKDNPPVEWSPPGDWKEEKGGGQFRYATFRMGDGVVMTVSPLGKAAGSLLDNVNRWRAQDLNTTPIGEQDLEKHTKELKLGGVTVTRVDMTGTGKVAKNPAPRPGGLQFSLPDGWKEAAADQISLHAFEVKDGKESARITISRAGGDLTANLNRWRVQMQLPEASKDQLDKDTKPLKVDGSQGTYADFSGPEKRILGVIVDHGGATWFIKMTGPKDLVGKQKAAFEAFVASIRF